MEAWREGGFPTPFSINDDLRQLFLDEVFYGRSRKTTKRRERRENKTIDFN
jgi:hypothetical protein